MKHKRRRATNPLAEPKSRRDLNLHRETNPLREYRRLQSDIRALYDPFTAQYCAGCAAPCCVKPTRVTPIDVALALGLGHSFPHLGGKDAYIPSLEYARYQLSPPVVTLPMAVTPKPTEFCEYLHEGRCTFPDDLRPFGCTLYVCGPMDTHLPPETLLRLKTLLQQLETTHAALLDTLAAGDSLSRGE